MKNASFEYKYNIGDKLITKNNKIVIVEAIQLFISELNVGYQYYVTNVKTNKSKFINEKDIYKKIN